MARIEIKTPGLAQLRQRVQALIDRTRDLTPVYRVASDAILALKEDAFDGERPPFAAPPWAQLNRAYEERKAQLGKHSKLIFRGNLRPHITAFATSSSVRFGIAPSTPYGKLHQFGAGQRARPFLPVSRTGKWIATGEAGALRRWLATAVKTYLRTGKVPAQPA